MRWHPNYCYDCGRKASKRYPISARGKCTRCAAAKFTEATLQVSSGVGPYADKWAAAIAKGARRKVERERAS